MTSRVVKAEGRYVWTASGSCYKLGAVDPDYIEFLEENGWNFDSESPFNTRRIQ
jgi:hypothetical protein